MNLLSKQMVFGVLLSAALAAGACQSAYYGTMEKFGVHKREVLVNRVEKARDSQEEAKEQFRSALEQFSTVLNVKGGALEEKYTKLDAEFQESEERAEEVHDRIALVEDVAEALFDEWRGELSEYTNEGLRRTSQRKLRETERRYDQLIGAMKRAEKRIEPVLSAFRDQVLFLKHNLNAQAIASLQAELVSVEAGVARLIREMEASIDEANTFIRAMAGE